MTTPSPETVPPNSSLSVAKGGAPDWAPWAVLVGLLVFGSAGALGLVPLPRVSAAASPPPAREVPVPNGGAPAPQPSPVVPAAAPSDAKVRPPGVPEAVEIRQILVQHAKSWKKAPQVTRSKEEAKQRCEEALAKLEHGTPWEKVMEEYSDNEDTRKNGGSIGMFHWDTASWLVKDPIFKLTKVGERSPVTESPFGYHVYQRTK